MAFKSLVMFERKLTDSEHVTRDNKIAELVAAGATDGTMSANPEGPPYPVVNQVVTRTWTTEQAANDWVAFVNTFAPAPISATVEPE